MQMLALLLGTSFCPSYVYSYFRHAIGAEEDSMSGVDVLCRWLKKFAESSDAAIMQEVNRLNNKALESREAKPAAEDESEEDKAEREFFEMEAETRTQAANKMYEESLSLYRGKAMTNDVCFP
ncbi:hypothetical protein KIPB_013307, partial [Kipferlia bialata]|eukprot:g13307.t1